MRDILEGRVHIISDTHFGHKAIAAMAKRPGHEKNDSYWHNQLIVNNWRECVGENDIVIHLGDVAFGSKSVYRWCEDLPGKVYVVKGNHDGRDEQQAMKNIGWTVVPRIRFKLNDVEFCLSHKPLEVMEKRADHLMINFCGHWHQHEAPTSQHINLSVERPEIMYGPKPILSICDIAVANARRKQQFANLNTNFITLK